MKVARAAPALLVAAALLTGCATLRVGTDGRSFEERRDVLAAVDAWEMRGRLTVDTGDGAFQGRFSWRQDVSSLELVVRTALGAGVLQVAGPRDALTVTARGETRTLVDPERELSELVGWWLPIGSLPAWLVGLPDPDFRAATELGSDGTLAAFEQRLWRAAYPVYQLADGEGRAGTVLVPRRIDLTHEDLELKLTIDEWRPASSARSP
ncbi:MAG TPA: lipoprotein insertase outer membrane protein LolB [Gammaproteobacteria bacterium]|nr:lipoprotein insertase outer membrane protein LolB [Gammaproteobacteria bacterium]